MSGDDYLAEYRHAGSVDFIRRNRRLAASMVDRKAVACGQHRPACAVHARVFRAHRAVLDQSMTVLEIGCGSGWGDSYQHPHVRYIAVDRDRCTHELGRTRGRVS